MLFSVVKILIRYIFFSLSQVSFINFSILFNSLIELLPRLGGTVYGLTPIVNDMGVDDKFYEDIKAKGGYVEVDAHVSSDEFKELAKTVYGV